MNTLLLASGFFSFINIMWVIVGVVMTVSLLWAFGVYLLPLIAELPAVVLEFIGWAACGAFVYLPAQYIEGGGIIALALVGCLGLIPCVIATFGVRMDRMGGDFVFKLCALILCVLWGGITVYHQSTVIGTLSVAMFLIWTGSFVIPLIEESMIFERRKLMSSVLFVSGPLLAIFLFTHIKGVGGPYLELFAPGVFWLAGLSYATSCLALSCRYYGDLDFAYLLNQVLATGSGVLAIYIGSVYNIPVLQELGGTYIALYMVEKFFEIPWSKDHWAFVGILFSAFLYGCVRFAEAHPQYFLGF